MLVVTRGYGSGGSIAKVVTRGYGAAAVAAAAAEVLSGGYAVPSGRRKTREDIRRGRALLGIPEPALEAIAEVAARQVARGETDELKRVEELHRELQLRSIEWESRYLKALSALRSRALEDARAAQQQAREDEEILLLLLAAAATL